MTVGFTPKSKVYRLDFSGDEELDGLVVKARSAPIGFVVELATFAERAQRSTADTAEDLAEMGQMIDRFADVLVEWNLELRQGEPTPANAQGLRQLEMGHFLRLITAWQQAVINVPAPLPQTSSGGEPSVEASLPMAPPSPSPPS